MQVFDVYLAFFSILSVAVFLMRFFKVPLAFAPLTAISMAAVWVSVGGMLGALKPFALTFYIVSFACLVLTVLSKKSKKQMWQFFTPGFLFFVLAGFGALTYLAIRQPLASQWDEFSLWATAVKTMKTTGLMYTKAEMGWFWTASQTPTLPSLAYFMQFFGKYAAWKIYAGYALLMLSVVSALLGGLTLKQYKIYIPLALTALLTPAFFTVFGRQYEVKLVWLSSYADVPAGMLFGGVLLMYYGLRNAKAPLWPLVPALMALALIKDNTFIFALIASGLFMLDLLLLHPKTPQAIKQTKGGAKGLLLPYAPGRWRFGARLVKGFGFMLFSVLPYFLWTRHIGKIVAAKAAGGQTGATSDALHIVLINGIKMLFKPAERTEQFSLALSGMKTAFVAHGENKVYVSTLGNGLITCLLILFIFVLAIILSADKTTRRRSLLAMLVSTLGFAAYYVELIFSYGLIFKPYMVSSLENYGRYLSSYYIGWFLLALCCLGLAARNSRPYALASGAGLVLSLCMWWLCVRVLPANISDIGYPAAYYDDFAKKEAVGAQLSQSVGASAQNRPRIFFVSQRHEMGLSWFQYAYYSLPAIIDYSGIPAEKDGIGGGGGRFVAPQHSKGGAFELNYSAEQLADYFISENCEYVFIENLDDEFIESYAELFEDGLLAAQQYEHLLYKVENADGEVVLRLQATFGERGQELEEE